MNTNWQSDNESIVKANKSHRNYLSHVDDDDDKDDPIVENHSTLKSRRLNAKCFSVVGRDLKGRRDRRWCAGSPLWPIQIEIRKSR